MTVALIFFAVSAVIVCIWPRLWIVVALSLSLLALSVFGFVCCTLPEYYVPLLIPLIGFCAVFGFVLWAIVFVRTRQWRRPPTP